MSATREAQELKILSVDRFRLLMMRGVVTRNMLTMTLHTLLQDMVAFDGSDMYKPDSGAIGPCQIGNGSPDEGSYDLRWWSKS